VVQTGLIDDPIFTTFYASNMQFISSTVEQEITTRDAGIALLEKINRPAFLITHSQGGLYGWTIADSRPHLVRGLIQLEPKGPPFEEAVFTTSFLRPWGLTSIPLKFDNEDAPPPLATAKVTLNSPDLVPYCVIQADPPRQLPNLAKVPILIVTAEASYHAMYDTCFVKFLNQAGVQRVEHWNLGDRGIHGNAHMMFMEKNSDEIASKLDAWMRAK
jgi:pimeloyl-ACP methyl ester carboxylesterase